VGVPLAIVGANRDLQQSVVVQSPVDLFTSTKETVVIILVVFLALPLLLRSLIVLTNSGCKIHLSHSCDLLYLGTHEDLCSLHWFQYHKTLDR